MIRKHILPQGWQTSQTRYRHSPIRVALIGCGGNGSALLLQLPYLHQALQAWGGAGLEVTVYDFDLVSNSNTVRQSFAASDVGLNKAVVLVSRLNCFWGLDWKAVPRHFSEQDTHSLESNDLLISCVDTRAARQMIYQVLRERRYGTHYWLDLGNSSSSGQFVLGTVPPRARKRLPDGLPSAVDLFPEIADADVADDDLPSCSAIEALQRQEPFINQTLAVASLAMLTRLFRYGELTYHGGQFNAEVGSIVPLPIDPDVWAKQRRYNRRVAARRAGRMAA